MRYIGPLAIGGSSGGITAVLDDPAPKLGGDLDPNGRTVGTATAADLAKLRALTRTAAEMNGTYLPGGTDVAIADGGTGASSASAALANLGAEAIANRGAAGGYAPLDSSQKVPAANLPSYVDDVVEAANLASFPAAGETGKIYTALDTGRIYRWGGSAYTEISPSPGSTDAVPEGSTNRYFTDGRADARVMATAAAATAAAVHAATAKATPDDADELALVDTAASNVLRRFTWSALKSALKSYYDGVTTTLTGKTISATNNTITGLAVGNFAGAAIVDSTETIAANNNDTTLPTSAATKAAIDAAVIAAGSGYTPGGTDVAVTDGGTGASTAAGALSNLGAEASANKGAANGYAPLDGSQKVPAANLPAYVDDVLEFDNQAAFPATGVKGLIFVALDTGRIYRWSGTAYVEISPSPGSTDAVPEGVTNLYYTQARVDARIPAATHAAASKATPVDADELALIDSGNGFVLKRLTIANLKAAVGGTPVSNLSGTFAALPAAGTTGRLYVCTDVDLVLRDNGTSWDRVHIGSEGGTATAPPTAGWTSAMGAGSTVAADRDGRLMTLPTGGGDTLRYEYRTLSPASNYTLTGYLEQGYYVKGGNHIGGILLRDGSGLMMTWGPAHDGGNGGIIPAVTKWTAGGQYNGYASTSPGYVVGGFPRWYRVRDDNTNRFYEYSLNGVDWVLFWSHPRTDYLTPTQYGWSFKNDNSGGTSVLRLRSLSLA